MKKKTIEERFDVLERLLKSDDFLANRGLGNEIGYYIFDYSPKNELLVREYINHLEAKNYPANDGYTLQVFNLYEIMMELLESKRYIDIIAQWEKKTWNYVCSNTY